MHDFISHKEDELCFVAGDNVYVTTQKTNDDGWWRGKMCHFVGLFPARLAAPQRRSDQKKSTKKSEKSRAKKEEESKKNPCKMIFGGTL